MCPFRRLKQSAKSNFLLLRTSGRDTGNEHTSFQTQSAGIQGSYSHAGKRKKWQQSFIPQAQGNP